jgi:beta-glucanase (GH16 family)
VKKLIVLMFFITQAIVCLNIKTVGNAKVTGINPDQDSILNINAWKKNRGIGDEFNSKNLDTSKWRMGLWYDISGDFAFKNENISVSDGNLHLTAKSEKYKEKEFTIGAVESKFELPAEPSMIRVRAKLLADSVNVCSAIWLQSWPEVISNPNPEIDIIEYFQKDEMHMNLFTWDKDNAGNYEHVDFNGNIFDYKKDISAEYHIYGLARIKGQLNFYFDDKLVCIWKCPNSNFSTMPRHVILSLEGHRYRPKVAMLPASFDIDWVRIYKK